MPECQMTKEYVLDIGHIDGRGIARPSAIVEFMQDIATCHAETMGLSGEALAENNAFWVLSRLKYQIERPLYSYEKVRLTTIPREIRGASWYRDFIIKDETGVIGHAVTVWAIVNLETRRLVRPKSLGLDFKKQETGQTEMLKAIHAEGLQPCFDRVVRYSDIDINRHLNNVKAVDILSDAFGLETQEKRWVSQLQVNYIAENTCGTTLNLRRAQGEDGSLCVSAFDGDTEKVQAEVIFSTL
ncbi:MAG: thioesterase [Clostridia bacterium]|nr:thioesterase [Clostridia bacterium]